MQYIIRNQFLDFSRDSNLKYEMFSGEELLLLLEFFLVCSEMQNQYLIGFTRKCKWQC